MTEKLTKDKSILDLLAQLEKRLGAKNFIVNDKWETDLCAIGIAHPKNPSVLVYICTYQKPSEKYFVSLELPPKEGSDQPYEPAGDVQTSDFEELIAIIQKHFKNV